MKITFLRSVIVTRAIHSAMAGHSNTLFELVSLYLSWISWCPSYFLQNICLLACYAEIWDPSREKVQETQPLKLKPTAAINFNLQPKHLPNGQLELIFLTYCTGKMHGHGIFEFFWRLVWCVGVLSRFIHLIENPQYAGGGAQRGPTAGVQVKNLNYMFHVDSGHHTLDIDNTSTWTKHCYSNHHSHSLSHVVVAIP